MQQTYSGTPQAGAPSTPHAATPMAQQTGEAYTRGTVALGRAFLAEHAEAAASAESGSS